MEKSDNELIADFHGLEWHENGTISNYPSAFNMSMGVDTIDDLKYDKSWDWIMSMVDKVEELGFSVTIKNDSCLIERTFNRQAKQGQSFSALSESKILAVVETITKFIKWFNQQSKS